MGEILEVYDPLTGKTDAITMQHDVDYSLWKDDRKCKNIADRKTVKALDGKSLTMKDNEANGWLKI